MDTTNSSAAVLLESLSIPEIQQRIHELDREAKALRVLLRAARARERLRDRIDRQEVRNG